MKRLGARVEHHGVDMDAALKWTEQQATEEGYRYIHPANEPKLIAGVASAGLEVIEDLPETDILICPVGGGSSSVAYCLTVGKLLDADVIGVQAEGARGMYRAYHEGHLEPQEGIDTFAEGLAIGIPFALTIGILREHMTDMLAVRDDDLLRGMYDLFSKQKILVEGAGAAALAAARELADDLASKTVVLQLSGRNISTENLRQLLDTHGEE